MKKCPILTVAAQISHSIRNYPIRRTSDKLVPCMLEKCAWFGGYRDAEKSLILCRAVDDPVITITRVEQDESGEYRP